MFARALRSIAFVDLGSVPKLVATVSLCIAVASLADASPQFDSWTTENGLPQNSVNDILQTRDGYLWLATFGGLVRFDGLRFVVFDRSIPGIGSVRAHVLYEDGRGTLWAATDDGMLIRHREGRFKTYDSADQLPHAAGVRIEEADDGSLWVTWTTGVITRFDGERFSTIRPDQLPHGVGPSQIRWWDLWWSRSTSGIHVLV